MTRLLTTLLSAVIVGSAGSAPASVCPPGTTHTHFHLALQGLSPVGCQWAMGTGPQVLMVDVQLLTTPVSQVRFSLPDPPFGTIGGEAWNFPYTGDHINGIEMTIGCTGAGVVSLGTLLLILDPGEDVPCTEWRVDSDCEAEDCNGDLVPSVSSPFTFISNQDLLSCSTCFQYCENLPPYDLYPPDGAANVPLDVELSWGGPVFEYTGDLDCWIQIGTDAECGTEQTIVVPCDTRSIVLDFLEPATTYYWRATWAILTGSGCSSGSGDRGTSVIHAFTTQSPLTSETATWGRVKAMYRE